MQITVTSRRVDMPVEVRNYIEEKVNNLPRFYDRIHEVEVVLGYESEQFTAEMIVRTDRKHTFVASDAGLDTHALIDAVTGKIERQLVKHKEKSRHHRHDGKTALPGAEPTEAE